MTTTRPIPPLTSLTEAEASILDAWLEVGTVNGAAKRTGKHRATVWRVLKRYRNALRQLVQEQRNADFATSCTLLERGM